MGDGIKLSKDKGHRSTSSLAGMVVDGTRSERKLEINALIPEVDDQFANAETLCDDLQDKIDLVKMLKRKKKLKKRSMTRVAEAPAHGENIPFISVSTQPKKKMSQQAVRLRRLEVPPNPTRGYLDPATVEQHRMIGQFRGYNQTYRPQSEQIKQRQASFIEPQISPRMRMRRTRADGDALISAEEAGFRAATALSSGQLEVACGDDVGLADFSDDDTFNDRRKSGPGNKTGDKRNLTAAASRRRHVPRDVPVKEVAKKTREEEDTRPRWGYNQPHRRRALVKQQPTTAPVAEVADAQSDDRPVVELFNKANRFAQPNARQRNYSPEKRFTAKNNTTQEVYNVKSDDHTTGPLRDVASVPLTREKHRRAYCNHRNRRYEQPTVASQMKQAGMRYCYETGYSSNIPFVVSKSTAPSHNIGVNIQQVLNGMKIQQPLSGIPLTIAHHMGLGHIPSHGTRSTVLQQPCLDNREMNVIRVGQRLLRLPSYRYMSYNRLLTLYREGDGIVPRFLRAISRPHYFYTSMYNLATNREDADAATSKGRAGQEAKQSLAEYAGLYREYEQVERCLKNGFQPELQARKEELSKELADREEHIRRVVQEYRSDAEQTTLRASASTAGDAYRHSTFKLNSGEPQQ